MNATVVFCPGRLRLDSPDVAEVIDAGKKQIRQDGELVVDMESWEKCDTAAVCLLLELLRVAKKNRCRLVVRNISEQLSKLLNLYQINIFFPPAN